MFFCVPSHAYLYAGHIQHGHDKQRWII